MPGDLLATALAARRAAARGKWVVMYKGGRSAEGQKAASSHTGALAGDWELQKALLKRAGVIVCESMGMYDAALAWLAAFPTGKPSRVAVITNAGYESVVSADLLVGAVTGHILEPAEVAEVKALLEAHKLQDLVAPRLPLDVTPMADEAAYLDCCRFALRTVADTVVVGLVPLTKRLDTTDPARMEAFANSLLEMAPAVRQAPGGGGGRRAAVRGLPPDVHEVRACRCSSPWKKRFPGFSFWPRPDTNREA